MVIRIRSIAMAQSWAARAGLAIAVLSLNACGGSSSGSGAPTALTLGGTVSGLSASGLVLINGTDSLTVPVNATSFTLPTPVAYQSAYAVQISTQPTGLICSVSNGTGNMPANSVTNVLIHCSVPWTWMGGSSTPYATSVYGTLGTPAPDNVPGARDSAVSWADHTGNLWLFGSIGCNTGSDTSNDLCNDLWRYTPSTGQWTWMGGSSTNDASGIYGTQGIASPTNMPGARSGAVSWTDSAGNLWLFGGSGYDANGVCNTLNDLWKYNPATQQWAWMSGSNSGEANGVYGTQGTAAPGNTPGARMWAVSWTDGAGNLWLFGGLGFGPNGAVGKLSDLWKYNPTTQQWAWMSGPNTGDTSGVYGTQGIAAASNHPGARTTAMSWTDNAGNLWLFGGAGYDSIGLISEQLNDLWMYNPIAQQWTWMSGSNMMASGGVHGTLGVPAPDNVPGARMGSNVWTDAAGNLWLFGGYGYTNYDDPPGSPGPSDIDFLSDLWTYNLITQQWTWVSGDSGIDAPSTYGMLGVVTEGNSPGARYAAVSWTDSDGNHWLFGGAGYGPTFEPAEFNDLWRF